MAKTIEVFIGRVVTGKKPLVVPAGSTVGDALEIAHDQYGMTMKDFEEFVVDGDSVDEDTELQNGQTIMFVQSVAGAK